MHRQDDLLHFGVGLFSEDPLNPSGGRYYLLHGTASEFLDFCRQGAIDKRQWHGALLLLHRGVQAVSELLSFTCELHYFLGASLELFKGCPGFVSDGADAQAR